VIAAKEALIDQVPAQRDVVFVQVPQYQVDLRLLVAQTHLEPLGDVFEQDQTA